MEPVEKPQWRLLNCSGDPATNLAFAGDLVLASRLLGTGSRLPLPLLPLMPRQSPGKEEGTNRGNNERPKLAQVGISPDEKHDTVNGRHAKD